MSLDFYIQTIMTFQEISAQTPLQMKITSDIKQYQKEHAKKTCAKDQQKDLLMKGISKRLAERYSKEWQV